VNEEAVKVVDTALRKNGGVCSINKDARDSVEALAAANLLATPAMRQCVSALTNIPNGSPGRGLNGKNVYLYFHSSDHAEAFFRSIDALLAERASREKPEPMWLPDYGHGTMRWWVKSQKDGERSGPFDTESQARCVAEALNREGGGRG